MRNISASGAIALRTDAGVTRERSREFHDGAGVVDVVIAPRQQRSTRGRAQRGGVEIVVADTLLRQAHRAPTYAPARRRRSTGRSRCRRAARSLRSARCLRCFDFEPRRRLSVARVEFRDRSVLRVLESVKPYDRRRRLARQTQTTPTHRRRSTKKRVSFIPQSLKERGRPDQFGGPLNQSLVISTCGAGTAR